MKQRKAKKIREKFLLEVESLDQEGRGVGKRDGKIVFVEGALPSESIEYERFRNKERFEIGTVTQIFKESSLRVEPKCPYFGAKDASCGGCALQHLEPRAQVAMKQKILMDALGHIGRVKPQQILPPIYGSFCTTDIGPDSLLETSQKRMRFWSVSEKNAPVMWQT